MEILPTNLRFKSPPVGRPTTTRVCVHHTAGDANQLVQDVHRGHLARGFIGVGYNILQQKDGKWYVGRGIDREGAHATGYNRNAIGIVLTGNFEEGPVPRGRWDSLVEMCVYLCVKYGLDYTDVVGHRELPGAATLCPGKHIVLSDLRNAVRGKLDGNSAHTYRVIVDGRQVGAYRHPIAAVTSALEEATTITIEKV